MSFGRTLYRFFDPDPQSRGFLPVSDFIEADEWNEKQWGIFWTVNEFPAGHRSKDFLIDILAWAVDIDEGTKEEQRARIAKFLTPTYVIETKNGYHVYYNARGATLERFAEIMDRLIYNLHGDPRAKDLSRVLRVPGSLHWKNPADPFGIRVVMQSESVYTEEDMLRNFPESEKVVQEKKQISKLLKFQSDGELFERIYALDCEAALERLSGHWSVGSESFSFKKVSRGHLNLFVNGKSTSCFIDENKRIGSSAGGGPTIWQWVNYYQRDHKKTYQAIKEVFPELFVEERK